MGSSKSNSLGRSPGWKEAKGALSGYARSIPIKARPIPVAREIGRLLIAARERDPHFLPLLEDCAIGVALHELRALSQAVRISHKTLKELFDSYGIEALSNSPGLDLLTSINRSFDKELPIKCKKRPVIHAEEARIAMINTLIEMLTEDQGSDRLPRMSAQEIYNALYAPEQMKITQMFYSNYLFNSLTFLVSSSQIDIDSVADKGLNKDLREYCDHISSKIIERARGRGWLPGEIPTKVNEWIDILEEVYA